MIFAEVIVCNILLIDIHFVKKTDTMTVLEGVVLQSLVMPSSKGNEVSKPASNGSF